MLLDKIIEIVNGFIIKERLADSTEKYCEAKRGDKVFVSSSLSYIKNKARLYGK